MFNHVSINMVPPAEMRYATVGDWQLKPSHNGKNETLEITIADTGNTSYNMLLATHEIVEAFLCWIDNITPEQVDRWDFAHPDDEEPGEVIGAPYYWQHACASIVERTVALAMNVSWDVYESVIEKTAEEVEKHVPAHKVHP